ncbi:MAG: F0F1 ATP synthase subunit B [Anaerolineaceae bacterium]|nr:F0F1 ATP synthase subunit B [Anaerolineaceae bacterium]
MEKLGINLGYLLVQIINFSLIFLIVRWFAMRPLMDMLENRRNKIEKSIVEADDALEEAENAREEAARVISEAQTRANVILRETSQRAEEAGREIRAAASAEAAKDRDATMQELAVERDEMLHKIRSHVSDLSIAAARKLIGDALRRDETYHHSLLKEFFSGIKDGEVIAFEDKELEGVVDDVEVAEVVSALPLTDEEQELVRKKLLDDLHNLIDVSFRVDPSILGGLIVRVGDHVLDGSVNRQLEELSRGLS